MSGLPTDNHGQESTSSQDEESTATVNEHRPGRYVNDINPALSQVTSSVVSYSGQDNLANTSSSAISGIDARSRRLTSGDLRVPPIAAMPDNITSLEEYARVLRDRDALERLAHHASRPNNRVYNTFPPPTLHARVDAHTIMQEKPCHRTSIFKMRSSTWTRTTPCRICVSPTGRGVIAG